MSQDSAAGFMRRLAAMIYDTFLVAALWLLSVFLWVVFLNDGKAVTGSILPLFLYLETAAFYIYFWRMNGQTLGMQAWRIKAVDAANGVMPMQKCLIRFLVATLSTLMLGLGFVWILFNKNKLAWHDIASETRIIYLGVP